MFWFSSRSLASILARRAAIQAERDRRSCIRDIFLMLDRKPIAYWY